MISTAMHGCCYFLVFRKQAFTSWESRWSEEATSSRCGGGGTSFWRKKRIWVEFHQIGSIPTSNDGAFLAWVVLLSSPSHRQIWLFFTNLPPQKLELQGDLKIIIGLEGGPENEFNKLRIPIFIDQSMMERERGEREEIQALSTKH
jgi:hypothetical protein